MRAHQEILSAKIDSIGVEGTVRNQQAHGGATNEGGSSNSQNEKGDHELTVTNAMMGNKFTEGDETVFEKLPTGSNKVTVYATMDADDIKVEKVDEISATVSRKQSPKRQRVLSRSRKALPAGKGSADANDATNTRMRDSLANTLQGTISSRSKDMKDLSQQMPQEPEGAAQPTGKAENDNSVPDLPQPKLATVESEYKEGRPPAALSQPSAELKVLQSSETIKLEESGSL